MSDILFQYQRVNPTTWAYLSSLLLVALYFKFNRIWSVRNGDLLGLIMLAPALLMVQYGLQHASDEPRAKIVEHAGYIWLFGVSGLFMFRLLLDAFMVRRPLLEPNLTIGGLTFLGGSLFLFLMGNVITGTPDQADVIGSERAADWRHLEASHSELSRLETHGPGFPLIFLLPHISTQTVLGDEGSSAPTGVSDEETQVGEAPLVHVATARVMAILSQLAIVIGLVLVGMRHFDNARTGIAVATLYLLLPYTSMWTGSVTHALPGALLVWAVVLYRRPLLSGAMSGLAFGTIYYPLFLLPLWLSFYWQRGLWRFVLGMLTMVGVLVVSLAFTSSDASMFWASVRQMFGLRIPVVDELSGAWQFWNPTFRYPILAGYIGLCLSMALWPAQKNLGTLISYSAAVMLGTQFWHAHSGGLALAWYLPLLLLTIFRPNVEDRVALSVIR
jgi:hypothetical protein